METASPGMPAPLSRATGSEVANMMQDPHINKLRSKDVSMEK
jgi:hypothetical protein